MSKGVSWRVVLVLLGVLALSYAMAASHAVSRGLGRLCLTGSVALLLVLAAGILLGRHYAVPRLARRLTYMAALAGPVILVPTATLSFMTPARPPWARVLPAALTGTSLGLVCGYLIVVFVLGAW